MKVGLLVAEESDNKQIDRQDSCFINIDYFCTCLGMSRHVMTNLARCHFSFIDIELVFFSKSFQICLWEFPSPKMRFYPNRKWITKKWKLRFSFLILLSNSLDRYKSHFLNSNANRKCTKKRNVSHCYIPYFEGLPSK